MNQHAHHSHAIVEEEHLPEQDGVEVESEDTGDLDVEDFASEEEEVDTPAKESKTKAKVTKKRGELPEGWVTPVGLAHVLTEKGYGGKDEDGDHLIVPPQMVYSYLKNAPKDHPFPVSTIKDSIGTERQALVLTEGLAWWDEKIARTAARKAKAKAPKVKAEVVEDEGDHEEAED